MDKWLITDNVHPSAKLQLEAMGFEVDWQPNISNEEVLNIIQDYVGLIISTKTIINRVLIDKATRLKVVGRVGAGMDHIDLNYCQEKGITCFSSPGGNAGAVAEHVVGMILGFSKNIIKANHQLKNGEWIRFENTGFELKGKTIGIIGFGNTGSNLAKKLSGFDCEILAYDKYLKHYGNSYTKEATFEEIVSKADIISFHVPLTKETHHCINSAFFDACLKTPLIINASRGAICNTSDLIIALEQKKIRGCCIDVFEDEPLQEGKVNAYQLYQKLMAFDNVIVSPHIAGWSVEAKRNMVDILMDSIRQWLNSANLKK
jgi:D-3-phosphoglycerate dehydrogenase